MKELIIHTHYSQSPEAWFFHTPGLKIVVPSTPYDAKGLLNASIEDPNPVLYFEHKYMYRSIKGLVPEDYYNIEIGKGDIKKIQIYFEKILRSVRKFEI